MLNHIGIGDKSNIGYTYTIVNSDTYYYFIGLAYKMGKMIGPRIKQARKKINMAQAELARRIGVSQPTVSDWESGKSDPIVENLSSIAILLNVNFEWLATGRGEMEYVNGISEPHTNYSVIPEDQRDLLDSYLKLKPGQRLALLDFLKKL